MTLVGGGGGGGGGGVSRKTSNETTAYNDIQSRNVMGQI